MASLKTQPEDFESAPSAFADVCQDLAKYELLKDLPEKVADQILKETWSGPATPDVGGSVHDLRAIAKAMMLSRAMMRNIRQNLFFAFVYNTLGIPVAAGVLYPFFGVLLSPIIAGAAMSLSSVSVVANALRLRNAKL